jgi:hypothetical protein
MERDDTCRVKQTARKVAVGVGADSELELPGHMYT